jgi:Tol biopolymer transport system component
MTRAKCNAIGSACFSISLTLAGCGGNVTFTADNPDGGTPPAPGSSTTATTTGAGTSTGTGTGTSTGTGNTGTSTTTGTMIPTTPDPANCVSALPADIRAKWIAFDSDRDNFVRQLYVMHPDGSAAERVLSDSSSIDKEPSFAPDGGRLAFTSDRAGAPQIHVVDLQTHAVTQVTRRMEGADQPSFSADGAWIAFHSGPSVYVIRPDGTDEKLVAKALDNFNAYFWPHFSANGTELVFDRNNEIDAKEIDGSNSRQIVQNWTTTIKAPAVSPDGHEVAYHVYCDSPGASIWTTPFATKTDPCKGRRVTPPGTGVSERPAWASSSVLAYELIDKSTNLATIAVISRDSGSQPCTLTPAGSDNRNPSWSP